MLEKRERRRILHLSVVTAIGLYAVLYVFTHFHYDLNDDVILMRSFAGNMGGVRETFNLYTHTLLAWLVHGLSLLWPSVAWFSALQVCLLAGATVAVLASITRQVRQAGRPLWLGWLMAVALVCCFLLPYLTSITYTTTAAVLGTAAVCMALAVDLYAHTAAVVRSVFLSFLWLLFAYMLRQVSAWPLLGFWLGALACVYILPARDSRPPLRPVLIALFVCGLTLGLLFVIRVLDIRFSGQAAYLQWQQARISAIDYGGISNAPANALASVGWTESERQLALQWYFLDGNMTTQAFETLAQYAQTLSLRDAVRTLQRLIMRSGLTLSLLGLLLFGVAAAWLRGMLHRVRNGWYYLMPLGCAAATGGALLYLAAQGRLPMRAAVTVLLPACAVVMWLAFRKSKPALPGGSVRRWGNRILAVLTAGVLCYGVATAWVSVYNPIFSRGVSAQTRFDRLESYARAHSDLLFVADNAFGYDSRLFTDASQAMTENVLYHWGSWNNHSQGYQALLQRYGFANDSLAPEDWLTGRVRLVEPTGQQPEALLLYLAERLGAPVEAVPEAQGEGYDVLLLRYAT